jgi:hypothetical protein
MADIVTCQHCQRELTGQHNFCPYCGEQIHQVSAAGVNSSSATRTEVGPPPPTEPEVKLGPSKPTKTSRRGDKVKTARYQLVDRRVVFGILGLLDIPIIVILATLLLRPRIDQPVPSLACDGLDPTGFALPKFESGLGGEIEEDTRFGTGTEYLIQTTLVVPANRRLLIEPGVKMLFENGSGIEVRGALYACGSEKEPITFTSEAGEPGSWQGLQFIEADDTSTISHALIQFGGDRTVYLEKSAPALFDVEIASSNAFAISSDGNKMPELMVDVVLEKNPFNGIEIRGGTTADVQNIEWPDHGFVYIVSGPLEVGENTALLIEPGAIVKFWQPPRGDAPGLRIRGLLKAEDVQFTSVYDSGDEMGGTTYLEARDPSPGDWAGISFLQGSDKSYIRNSLVLYAGQGQAAIRLQGTSPTLNNLIISDSAWYPIGVDADSLPILENLSLVENSPGDAMLIHGGSAVTGRQEFTWARLGGDEQIVRVIQGEVRVAPEATLIIQPGVVVKFEQDSRLVIQGTLRAVGGQDDGERIVFTSLRDDEYGGRTDINTGPQDPRKWDGIVFDNTDGSSVLQNVIVRYGSIGLNNASPRLLDNLITDSESAAIVASPMSSPELRDNQLRDNDIDGIFIVRGTVNDDTNWPLLGDENQQIVRVLGGEVTIAQAATLNIEAGTVIKANNDGRIVVQGELRASGRSGQPVVFTSLHDDSAGGDTNQQLRDASRGDWPGVEIGAGGEASFAYTAIRYPRTGLVLRGGVVPAIDGWLRVTDGNSALWCDGRAEMPGTFQAEDNEDNYRQCPTQ